MRFILIAFAALAFSACNAIGDYGDDAICGNNRLEIGEICDGIYFQPGYSHCSAFDSSKNWISGTPRCSEACELIQGTCTE